MRRSLFTTFARATAALALAAAASAVLAPPASAFCSNAKRSVFFVAFPEGSDAPPPGLMAAFAAHLTPDLGANLYVDTYDVLASGDIAEGEAWDSAPAESRAADRALGGRRAAALEKMIRDQAGAPLGDRVRTTVRDNRQVFTPAELAANPALNPRIRAGIVADIRYRAPKRKKGEPVPTC